MHRGKVFLLVKCAAVRMVSCSICVELKIRIVLIQ